MMLRKLLAVLICVLSASSWVAYPEGTDVLYQDDALHMQINSVQLRREQGGIRIFSKSDINLPEKIIRVIRSGVSIPVLYEFRVMRARSGFDQQEVLLSWLPQMRYDLVHARFELLLDDLLARNDAAEFNTLAEVIVSLSNLDSDVIRDPRFLEIFEQEEGLYVQARLSIPLSSLPQPLQLDLLFHHPSVIYNRWIDFPVSFEKSSSQ